jgi:hypothetical protein
VLNGRLLSGKLLNRKVWSGLREFRLYALCVPFAVIVYALAGYWVPLVRPDLAHSSGGDIRKQIDHPVVIEVVPNMPTSVQLSPNALAIKPGQTFDLEVDLTTAYTTRGTQFGLSYDPNLIEITKVDEGEYYRGWAIQNKAATGVFPSIKIDSQRGLVWPFGIAVLGGPPSAGPSGAGVLATIQGRAKPGATGTTTLKLQAVEISSVMSSNVNDGGNIASVPSFSVGDAVISIGDNAAAPPTPASRALILTPTPTH